MKRAPEEFFERLDFLNIERVGFWRPSDGKELMSMDGRYAVFAGAKNCRRRLKQLFHYSDGHGDVGLLVATGRKGYRAFIDSISGLYASRLVKATRQLNFW